MEEADRRLSVGADSRFSLPVQTARGLLDAEDLETLSFGDLLRFFHADEALKPHLPAEQRREDPRSHLPVYYSESRSKRPHSYGTDPGDCPICAGRITRILDFHRLPSGIEEEYAFINKNLYPIAFPGRGASWGLHFLIWPSTVHSRNFRTMEPGATAAVLSRIAALERLLIGRAEAPGHACLIKNEGAQVGGSIAHDHFQLLFTRAEPTAFRNDRLFREEHSRSFTAALLEENGAECTVHEEGIWRVLVPRFMKRPYDLYIVSRDEETRRLSDLRPADLAVLGGIMRRVFLSSDLLFSRLRRKPAFNLITHNSGQSGLYFEFLPYTQETGGFEQLGLYLCQTMPEHAAEFYREHF